MMTIKIMRYGELLAEHYNITRVEIKWIKEFNWYGTVLHSDYGTATYENPVEMFRYDPVNNEYEQI